MGHLSHMETHNIVNYGIVDKCMTSLLQNVGAVH
jgi:hypothetical protein